MRVQSLITRVFMVFIIHLSYLGNIGKRVYMQENHIKTVLLYTIYVGKNLSDVIINFQVYPGLYDHVTIFHDIGRDDKTFYLLDRFLTPEVSITSDERAGIAISVWSNAFLYAGGIWQVRWSHENERHILQGICATDLELMEVATLLSSEELRLVEQAIWFAYEFWQKQYPDATFMFIGCEEVDGNTFEFHRHATNADQIDWNQKKTWHVVHHRFTLEGSNPTVCHALVQYHPDRPDDERFTVELA